MQSEAPAWKEPMRPLNYEVMFDVEDHHWWFVGRRAIVFSQIEDALGANLGAHAAPRAGVPTAGSLSEVTHAGPRALPGLRVLDIGCGAGATMDHLKRYGQPHGIDLSALPLRFSRQRGHQRTLRASATELPFDSESFDLVTALDVIEHLENDSEGSVRNPPRFKAGRACGDFRSRVSIAVGAERRSIGTQTPLSFERVARGGREIRPTRRADQLR